MLKLMGKKKSQVYTQGHIAQSVVCLTADLCLTADPGVASLILAGSHTFVEINREIIFMAILLPSADSRRVAVSYKLKYVHKVTGCAEMTRSVNSGQPGMV